MTTDSERLKLILGIKIKQLRQDQHINLSSLAEKAGVSVSYLNEIESGKKYPKFEKIISIAKSLDTTYEELVSPKLDKRLEPVIELLNSSVLQELPLELFGIEPSDLIDILAKAPTRFSAFINTIIEISRSYEMRVEQFLFSALRSYQELHDNYFEDIEQAADDCRNEIQAWGTTTDKAELVKRLLIRNHQYIVEEFDEQSIPAFLNVRSVFLTVHNKLLINKRLTNEQRAFTFSRELGYKQMNLVSRPLISPASTAESFEEILNNYKASYFAGALLIPKDQLAASLRPFFKNAEWDSQAFLNLMNYFDATPEMFLQRITNIMKEVFGINRLFFIRFNNRVGESIFHLSKELHLAKLHNPHATHREHYCRRWVSLTILEELATLQEQGADSEEIICRAQISEYDNSPNRYLVISLAKKSPPRPQVNSSVSIGLAIDENLTGLIQFLNDPKLMKRAVGETCERCSIKDCKERVVPPIVLNQIEVQKAIQDTFVRLNQ